MAYYIFAEQSNVIEYWDTLKSLTLHLEQMENSRFLVSQYLSTFGYYSSHN